MKEKLEALFWEVLLVVFWPAVVSVMLFVSLGTARPDWFAQDLAWVFDLRQWFPHLSEWWLKFWVVALPIWALGISANHPEVFGAPRK